MELTVTLNIVLFILCFYDDVVTFCFWLSGWQCAKQSMHTSVHLGASSDLDNLHNSATLRWNKKKMYRLMHFIRSVAQHNLRFGGFLFIFNHFSVFLFPVCVHFELDSPTFTKVQILARI